MYMCDKKKLLERNDPEIRRFLRVGFCEETTHPQRGLPILE